MLFEFANGSDELLIKFLDHILKPEKVMTFLATNPAATTDEELEKQRR